MAHRSLLPMMCCTSPADGPGDGHNVNLQVDQVDQVDTSTKARNMPVLLLGPHRLQITSGLLARFTMPGDGTDVLEEHPPKEVRASGSRGLRFAPLKIGSDFQNGGYAESITALGLCIGRGWLVGV